MIKQLLNSLIAKYRDLSVARRSIIYLCPRKIIDLLATDKARYFAQPRPIIVYYYIIIELNPHWGFLVTDYIKYYAYLFYLAYIACVAGGFKGYFRCPRLNPNP
jgi:hypothetical protein